MVLIGNIQTTQGNFYFGHYGYVIRFDANTAVKIFINHTDRRDSKFEYDNEVAAYEKAITDDLIIKYIPKFYGRATVEKVLNSEGLDISAKFHLDMAFVVEWIDYKFFKYSELSIPHKKLADGVIFDFKKSGINYLEDSSFAIVDESYVYVVDFGIVQHEKYWLT